MRLPTIQTHYYSTHPMLGEERRHPLGEAWRRDVGKATVVFVSGEHSLALVLDRAALEDVAAMLQEVLEDWR